MRRKLRSKVSLRAASGICRAAGGVADAQDHHVIADDAIADDVGIIRDQFPHVGSGHRPPPVRKTRQTVPGATQILRDVRRRARVELLDIGPDMAQTGKRRLGPDDYTQRAFGSGHGNWFGVPHELQPLRHLGMRHDATGGIVR